MKKIRFSLLPVLAVVLLALAGCVKKEFDEPPVYIPTAGFDANVSIAGLKAMYHGLLMEITADTIIQGVVAANDESGNIYKALYIQDETSGIEVIIDVTDLYTEYKVGQKILVKCKGLYLGEYGGLIQLGYLYQGSIGRIPESMVASHIYRDSLPGNPPVADTLDVTSEAMFASKLAELVAIKNVRFPDADEGLAYVATGETATNRDIGDLDGNTIVVGGESLILRTSKYANFANALLPKGKGTLVGILSIFNGQYQIYIRDTNDCVGFDGSIIPPVEPNATIAQLKAYLGGMQLKEITADTVIQGVVTANDMSGNIYKTLFIQDETGGIEVKLDNSSLYSMYPLGQKISVKCKGMYLGLYGGIIQLGYDYNGAIGRLPDAMIASHLIKQGIPGAVPAPDVLDLSAPATLDGKIAKLVSVSPIMFANAGQSYATSTATTNRDITDTTGAVIKINGKNFVLRTSNYANFASELMPSGKGTLVGILSRYNDQYQMYIRDTNDCVNFSASGMVTTIYAQNFDVAPTDWVVFSVASNKDWAFDATYQVMYANGYQGDVPSEDWLISPAINLTGVTESVLTFNTWTKYTDSGLPKPLDVLISTDYSGSGSPSAATWTAVTCTLPAANSGTWTSSGDVDLSMYNQPVYIGYKYRSSGVTTSTASKWEVDSFKVVGKK